MKLIQVNEYLKIITFFTISTYSIILLQYYYNGLFVMLGE